MLLLSLEANVGNGSSLRSVCRPRTARHLRAVCGRGGETSGAFSQSQTAPAGPRCAPAPHGTQGRGQRGWRYAPAGPGSSGAASDAVVDTARRPVKTRALVTAARGATHGWQRMARIVVERAAIVLERSTRRYRRSMSVRLEPSRVVRRTDRSNLEVFVRDWPRTTRTRT